MRSHWDADRCRDEWPDTHLMHHGSRLASTRRRRRSPSLRPGFARNLRGWVISSSSVEGLTHWSYAPVSEREALERACIIEAALQVALAKSTAE